MNAYDTSDINIKYKKTDTFHHIPSSLLDLIMDISDADIMGIFDSDVDDDSPAEKEPMDSNIITLDMFGEGSHKTSSSKELTARYLSTN